MEEVMEVRKRQRLNFEELEETRQYCETNYYKQTALSSSTHIMAPSDFWADYAQHLLSNAEREEKQGFLSANFTSAVDSYSSAFFAMAVLDLPFECEVHGYKTNESRGVEIKAVHNLILFKKEVREAPLDVKTDVIVTHRYIEEGNEQGSAEADKEFLSNKVYNCEVILTNISPE